MIAWLTTFHGTWSELAIALMVMSGSWMGWDMFRRRRAMRGSVASPPAATPPYDWARDGRLRQAVTCRRVS